MIRPLKKLLKSYHRLGYRPVVKLAPRDAARFNRMIVVFNGKDVQWVIFYNTKTETIIGTV